jgi:hypothetical protein
VLGFITAIALFVAGGRIRDGAVEGLAVVGLTVISWVVVAEHLRDPEELALVALLVGLGLLAVALAREAPARLAVRRRPILLGTAPAPRTLDQPPTPPTVPNVRPPSPPGAGG